jgi:Wax ester synthase/diacylglycerol acyltransferase catalytic domain/WS/DGAT C-terminal domain
MTCDRSANYANGHGFPHDETYVYWMKRWAPPTTHDEGGFVRRRELGSGRSLTSMAEHLTPLDATFLELEEADESAHMHIGGIMVFDPLPNGGTPTREELRRHLAARLGQLPRYGQRLSQPHTGGLSWPTWDDDPAFDLSAHIGRAALPAPGGCEELREWASDFFSQRLDRHRPLWEMAIVEGLADGRWALAHKTHHCMVDGVGSVDVGHLLLDVTADARRDDAGAAEARSPLGEARPISADESSAHGPLASLAHAWTGAMPGLFNVTITNVPGPQQTLYAFGAPLREIHPLVPLAAEHALGVAVVSYAGVLFFGVVADRDAVPDLGVMLAAMRDSLAELLALARAQGASPRSGASSPTRSRRASAQQRP